MTVEVLVKGLDLLLTMDPSLGEGLMGAIAHGAVALDGGRVVWVGPESEAPDAERVVVAEGGVGLPGLVDCHTHAVWAGSRVQEWERKLAGARYEEILAAGGGILSTVGATRAAGDAELLELAAGRLVRARRLGVTTVEVKSGYGLSPLHEARLLRVARQAAQRADVEVSTTFLGAHTVPAEHRADRDAYVREVIEAQLPAVLGLADAIDAYVDVGAFSVDEGRAILSAGRDAGLALRVHAEQVQRTGAAAMAASLGARSADHLERIDEAGIAALAAADTTGVLLPGAMLYLRDQSPPVAALREAGVRLAVATDLNPGTSPVASLWTAATLACLGMRLTVDEALRGITVEAARVLGRDDVGTLAPGSVGGVIVARPADWDPATPAALLNGLNGPTITHVIRR